MQQWRCRSGHVRYGEDEREEKFGIRIVEADAEMGFRINGVTTLLNGACIHSDNGLLGACSYPEAERRKVRLLKENGYNAVRCAHNPCSIAFLEACDEEGLLVMDEYADMRGASLPLTLSKGTGVERKE